MLFCNNCFQPESENQDGKMQICISCKKVRREVRYCNKYVNKPSESYALLSSHLLNRDCQRAHWKEHKRECGKEFGTLAAYFFGICLIIWHSDFGSLQDDVSPITIGGSTSLRLDIPPVAPGYRRTPYLLRLISCLTRRPMTDVSIDYALQSYDISWMSQYVILRPASNPGSYKLHGFRLSEVFDAVNFIVMRNRAMRNADEAALSYVYCALQEWEMSTGEESRVVAQLGKEYGPPFERVLHALSIGRPPAVEQVLSTEVDEVLGFLQQSGRFQKELEGYVPGSGGKMLKMESKVQISFAYWSVFRLLIWSV